ncbi:hypothetical protein Ahy_A10g050679 isoform A [Arachis hypogaea]|uniref:Uncharacterized protein n=1 Tax=Arachis hypogaea TaxID=3818 RepID=A0A445BA54_ARAHY|nr:hypothetical protein Ahy_A10g050679 isoform A [Arachis hypogaea]
MHQQHAPEPSVVVLRKFVVIVKEIKSQPQPKNPSTLSLHHRRKEWHTAASVVLKVRHPSVYLASLVIQVFNPCSLSPIAAASSSSASVVFVCLAALPSPFVCRSRSRLRSRSSPFTFARRSLFAVRVQSPFTVRVRIRVRLETTFLCFKHRDQPARPPSCRTALFCRRREFPKPATRQYPHTTPILCFKLCNF